MRAEKQEYYRKITLSSCNTEVHEVALRYTKKGKNNVNSGLDSGTLEKINASVRNSALNPDLPAGKQDDNHGGFSFHLFLLSHISLLTSQDSYLTSHISRLKTHNLPPSFLKKRLTRLRFTPRSL